MRLGFIFKVKELPIDYRMAIVSIIKDCLQRSDMTYFKRLYNNQHRTKPFAFAPYLRNIRIVENKILLEELQITVSSPDYEFLLHLYNGLQQKKLYSYKNYELTRRSMYMLPEVQINEPSLIFKTMSPLLVEDKDGNSIEPSSPDYNFHFSYLADMILTEYRGHGLLAPLKMEPIRMKKAVIKESNHEYEARFGHEKFLFFTAYQGSFRLTGDISDLQLLYQLGISKRRNQGFGLFRIA